MSIFKSVLIFLFLNSVAIVSIAQTVDEPRCSSMDYLQMQLQQHPELATAIKQNETALELWMAKHKNESSRGIITIPIVVHLVYNPAINMQLSDWQVKSQIDVLNEDYRRQNADIYKTPSDFGGAAADCEIQFCLAKRDPSGNPTTGILREPYPDASSFGMDSFDMYKVTHWPREDYLNIWVAKLDNSILGYTTFPIETSYLDGVVITDTAFGRIGELKGKYNRGRTGTHEVGHWLNLIHVWGDDTGCNGTDYCDDTPNQGDYNVGCPMHPHISCSNNGDMFMNYLDYVHDSCMNIFTHDQKARMIATLNTQRQSILLSQGCNSPVTYNYDLEVTSIINPSQAVNHRYIDPQVRVTNLGSQDITGFTLFYQFYNQDLHSYVYNSTLAAGSTDVLTLPQIRDSIGYNFFMAYAKNTLGTNGLVDETDTVNNFATRSYYVSEDANNDPNGMEVRQSELGQNPFMIAFDLLVYDHFNLAVFNVLGQQVKTSVSDAGYNTLEVSLKNVTPGVYFIKAINGGKKLTKSVIVLSP